MDVVIGKRHSWLSYKFTQIVIQIIINLFIKTLTRNNLELNHLLNIQITLVKLFIYIIIQNKLVNQILIKDSINYNNNNNNNIDFV